jgi:hypothetical protein
MSAFTSTSQASFCRSWLQSAYPGEQITVHCLACGGGIRPRSASNCSTFVKVLALALLAVGEITRFLFAYGTTSAIVHHITVYKGLAAVVPLKRIAVSIRTRHCRWTCTCLTCMWRKHWVPPSNLTPHICQCTRTCLCCKR